MQTITRKFLVKDIPNLTSLKKISNKRFYLYIGDTIVIRVQSMGGTYELERKADSSELVRESQKVSITKGEFQALADLATQEISRDSYLISEHPHLVLKIYHENYEGLVRAEVTFESIKEMESFKPPEWLGREITNSSLAKDGALLKLSKEEFAELIK